MSCCDRWGARDFALTRQLLWTQLLYRLLVGDARNATRSSIPAPSSR